MMDKRAGAHEKFQSRMDAMEGVGEGEREGGGVYIYVITREENGLVNLQVASSRCSRN